jgi:hypothetical protein
MIAPSIVFCLLTLCSGTAGRGQNSPSPAASVPPCAYQEQRWGQLHYLGGAIDVPPTPRGRVAWKWEDTLLISCQSIRLQVRNGGLVEFAPSRITGIVFEGPRGGAGLIVLGAVTTGVLGALAAWRLASSLPCYIAIEYTLNDGRKTGVLLQVHRKNFDDILAGLKAVTNLPPSKSLPSPSAEAPGPSTSPQP